MRFNHLSGAIRLMKKLAFKHQGQELVSDVRLADTFCSRGMGLMFKKEMDGYEGLLLRPSNSIHTFCMRFDIDVVFLNKKLEVIKVFENLKPWRITLPYLRASQVLELKAGTLKGRVKKGDQLEMTCIS